VHVAVKDGIARDGVIQVVPRVLIPPHKHKKHHPKELEQGEWNWEETEEEFGPEGISLEEFKERLEPYIAEEEGNSNHGVKEQIPLLGKVLRMEF